LGTVNYNYQETCHFNRKNLQGIVSPEFYAEIVRLHIDGVAQEIKENKGGMPPFSDKSKYVKKGASN
jgi:hypothetical protein